MEPRNTDNLCNSRDALRRGVFVVQSAFVLLAICISPASAAWIDGGAAWSFRRPLSVVWDAEHPAGGDTAEADFYTPDLHKPDATDIRVATEDGKPVPFKVLMTGPGDRVRLVFALAENVRKYYVYFGNPASPPPTAVLDPKDIRGGLLMEMRELNAVQTDDFKQIQAAWDRSSTLIGRKMIDRVFLGVNPFGQQEQIISRLSGFLFVPLDGQYTLIASAHNKAALYIDGKPLVFAPWLVGDIRFNARDRLTRGWHSFLYYHVNRGGDGQCVAAWIRPDAQGLEIIPRESFGLVRRGIPGPLEDRRGAFLADFTFEQKGEGFFANRYAQRYQFSAGVPEANVPPSFQWDFGDGQSASGAECQHVYLADGVYSVRLTLRVGAHSDTRTTRIAVSRNYERISNPPVDMLPAHSAIVAAYDLNALPAASLINAVWLHLRASDLSAMQTAAEQLALRSRGANRDEALRVLREVDHELLKAGKVDAAVAMWKKVAPDSPLQPQAAIRLAEDLLWRRGDFEQAVAVLQPFASRRDPQLQRLYAQALILNQSAAEGGKILRDLPVRGRPELESVMSGAAARNVEYSITEGDWEAGEERWEKWQSQYPADFLGGYSVLLRARLIEIRKMPQVAARVAEAFAKAVPTSSYAPRLLDLASKLLAGSDPDKSAALRRTLKERYPEDPLSQK